MSVLKGYIKSANGYADGFTSDDDYYNFLQDMELSLDPDQHERLSDFITGQGDILVKTIGNKLMSMGFEIKARTALAPYRKYKVKSTKTSTDIEGVSFGYRPDRDMSAQEYKEFEKWVKRLVTSNPFKNGYNGVMFLDVRTSPYNPDASAFFIIFDIRIN